MCMHCAHVSLLSLLQMLKWLQTSFSEHFEEATLVRVNLEGLDLPMSAEAFAEVQKEHCDKVR